MCRTIVGSDCSNTGQGISFPYTRDVRKLSGHFEYREKRSRGLDVTWQPEWTLLSIREQSLSRGSSQSAVRRRWLILCTVWLSHLQIPYLSTGNLALGKARSRSEPNLDLMGLTDKADMIFRQNSLHESRTLGRSIVMMKLICSLGYFESDDHTVHKISQRRLTADWLAPRESDWSRMHSKVSSDCLPSYIKAMGPVLEMFTMAGYFPESPRKFSRQTFDSYNPRVWCNTDIPFTNGFL